MLSARSKAMLSGHVLGSVWKRPEGRIIGAVLLGFIFLAGSRVTYANELTGQRLKIKGQWTGERLEAKRVERREPKKDPRRGRVTGRIDEVNPTARTLRIGPFLVQWNDTPQLDGISPETLTPGRSIEAAGRLTDRAHFLATSIKAASSPPHYLQIRGTVTKEERRPDGSMQLTVLGVQVNVPRGVYARGRELTRHPDDRRPQEQFTVRLWGRPLTIGGELETETLYRGNFKLRDRARDDVFRLDQELQLEFFYPLTESILLFWEGKALYEAELFTEDGEQEVQRILQRGETWLYTGNLFGSDFSLQIGRQNFREEREWWWDANLDALRIHYDCWNLHAELAVAQKVGRVATEENPNSPEFDDALRLLGHGAWSWAKDQRLDTFFLYQDDHPSQQSVGQLISEDRENPSEAELLWLGARVSGELDLDRFGELDYRLEGAWVGGRETLFDFEDAERGHSRVSSRTKRDVSGWALDGGMTWETRLPRQPTLALSYALGSGDRKPHRGEDQAFRQTGLYDNNGRFHGVNRFRYYGELLRPELSNLHIWTASVGFRFWKSSSVEFVYHLYHQVHPTPSLRGARLKAKPLGKQRTVGQEWDLVLGLEEWKHIEIELIGALFRAGSAYGPLSGETAYGVILEMDYNF
jgi:hypothetical protein